MNKAVMVMVVFLVLGLASTDALAWGRKNRANNQRLAQLEKQNEKSSWTVQGVAPAIGGMTTLTLKGKDEVKELKVSSMTEVVIDGAAKKPGDITEGMKSVSFTMAGNNMPLSRIVLESSGTPASPKNK